MLIFQSNRINHFLSWLVLLPLLFIGSGSFHHHNGHYISTVPVNLSEKTASENFQTGKNLLGENEVDQSIVAFDKSASQFEKLKNSTGTCRSLLMLAECYRIKGNLHDSRSSLNKAWNILASTKSIDPILLADYHKTSGTTDYYEGKLDLAQKSVTKAIELRTNTNGANDTSLAMCYSILASVNQSQNNLDEALKYYQKAVQLAGFQKGAPDGELADYFYNIALIHKTKGDYAQALISTAKSEEILSKAYGETDSRLLDVCILKGVLLDKTGRYDESLQCYEKAGTIVSAFKKKDPNWESYIYLNKGNVLLKLGDLEKASSCYQYTLNTLQSNALNNSSRIATSYHNLGIINFKKGNYPKAMENYLKSAEIRKTNNLFDLAGSYLGLAGCYAQLNNPKEAVKYYELAINEHKKISAKLPDLSNDYLSYGTFCLNHGQYSKAKKLVNMALELNLDNFGENHPETSKSYCSLGDFYNSLTDRTKALNFYQKAIASATNGLNNLNGKLESCYGPELLSALKKKAHTLSDSKDLPLQTSDLTESLKSYEEALQIIHNLRTSYTGFQSKIDVSGNEKRTYEEAITLALKLFDKTKNISYKTKAFELAEKSKSAVLISSLKEKKAISFGDVPDSLIAKEQRTSSNIETLEGMIQTESSKKSPDAKLLDQWKNKIFKLKDEQASLIGYFEKNFPNYYRLKYDDKTLTVSEVTRKLSRNQVLLEYVITDNQIITFALTQDKYEVYRTQKPADFEHQLEILRDYLDGQNFYEQNTKSFSNYLKSASNLYNTLLKPAESLIGSKDIVVVTDDQLSFIPFETLLTGPVDANADYSGLPYLILKNAVGYAYSANLLFFDGEKGNNGSKIRLAAFAPTYNMAAGEKSLAGNMTRNSLAPLPFAQEEAQSVSKIFRGDVFGKSTASKQNFKDMAGNYDILHLSMHTIIDNENPMYSRLAFANANNSNEEGFLNTYEIFNMRLHAKMAVLSACNTGIGKVQKGEGMMSLARGFYYAGCPDVVMTLWPVEDKVSTQLVKDFYKFLSEGKNKAEALRLAKINYLKDADPMRAHPYFWAGYVNIGDISPLIQKESTQTMPSLYFLACIGGLLVLMVPLLWRLF